VSPDGTRFLVNALIADATPPAITVVANWTSLVPRLRASRFGEAGAP